MNKAKIIAISAMCAALVFGCLALVTVPAVKYLALILAVLASIATVIPLLLDGKNIVYTLLVYVVGSVLGMFLGIANVVYIAPIITFCIPFTIVKVSAETVVVTAQVNGEGVLEDPFDSKDDKKVVKVKVETKRKMPKVVQWILYFVLLEVSIALTLLATYLFTPAVYSTIVGNQWFWWLVAILQLCVFPYDLLMRGCLIETSKILQKAIKTR